MGSTNVKTNKIEFITRILDTYTPTDISTTPYTLDEHGNIPSALSAAPAEEDEGKVDEGKEVAEGETIEATGGVGQGEEGEEEELKEQEIAEVGRDAKRRKA
jgi:hypothetical protein